MKKFAKISFLMLLTVFISTMFSACGLFGLSNDNQGVTNDNETPQDRPSISEPDDKLDYKEFCILQEKIVGTWEYKCDEHTIIEFGRPESEYGMSGVNSALNDYIKSIGFTPRDECKNLSDYRYFIDKLSLRHGIVGQKLIFGADNSLQFSIQFQTDFQVYPSQIDHYDASMNWIQGEVSNAVSIPNEIPPCTVPYGYFLTNSSNQGMMLQNISTWDIQFTNMRLVDDNTLEVHYIRLGSAKAETLSFERIV